MAMKSVAVWLLGACVLINASQAQSADTQVGTGVSGLVQMAQAGPSAEDIFWQSVQNSTDPAMFQAYLDQVANGTFKGVYKPLADIKLKALRGSVPPNPNDAATTPSPPAVQPAATPPKPDAPEPAQTVQGPSSQIIEACDRAASSSLDEEKPSHIPGMDMSKIDPFAATKACLEASKLPDAPARIFFQLGRCYQQSENYKDALASFQTAVTKGHKRAAVYVAGILVQNHRGIRKDPVAALSLLELAANAKVPDALNDLGEYYRLGWGGRRDYAKAIDYYNQSIASSKGVFGYASLGAMTYDGTGVRRNRNKACQLWQQGATAGDTNSADYSKRFCKYR
ncbi:hypothetical protein [Labrys neptuniae]